MMAKTLLFETGTVNFRDIIGNGKIYRVPLYQRDYSWNQENWEDLWSDILDLNADATAYPYHYMGSILLQPKSERDFEVIDGQQRLATLSIISTVIIHKLAELVNKNISAEENQERKQILERAFLGDKDPKSLCYSRKLFLNANNDYFYENNLLRAIKPFSLRSLPKTNQLLWQAFNFFSEELDKLSNIVQSGEALASFLSEIVADKLLFIEIKVEDEINAYTVFETLNTRRVELSSTDLLKNYLFSLLHGSSDFELGQKKWQQIISTIQPENFPDLLRYFLSLTHKNVRHKNLFKITKKIIRNKQEVFDLLDSIENFAELFIALKDPTHEIWRESKDNQEYIRELCLFNVRQVFSVLFAAHQKFNNNDFTRILKLAVVVSFRYNIISGLNPNKFEDIYNDAAINIYNGTLISPREVFETLQSVYVKDEEFKSNFKYLPPLVTKGRSRKLVRYILYKLERDASSKNADFETDSGTIEHILPENPSDSWSKFFTPNEQQTSVYRLGNLTILESGLNRDITNDSYDIKKQAYHQSKYALSKNITAAIWNSIALEQRQEQMAQRAAHVWKIDFS